MRLISSSELAGQDALQPGQFDTAPIISMPHPRRLGDMRQAGKEVSGNLAKIGGMDAVRAFTLLVPLLP